MEPLISIIIPTYNSEKHLVDCLESVFKQTYSNLEVIIVDGQSTDSTTKIVSKYCKANSNWKLISTNKGVSHQRNVGLDNFKGDFVFFLDSDDYISPNLISDLYNKLISDDLDLVTPEVHNKFFKNDILVETKIIEPIIRREVTTDNFFINAYNSFLGGPTKLFKKELFKGAKHDENLSNGEDLLFNYQIVKQNGTIKYGLCRGAIYYYRHDITVTNPANRRLNRSGYQFCDEMVSILESTRNKDENFYGALTILKIQLDLFMKAYLSNKHRIPRELSRSRRFLYNNLNSKYKYYYKHPKLFNLIKAISGK